MGSDPARMTAGISTAIAGPFLAALCAVTLTVRQKGMLEQRKMTVFGPWLRAEPGLTNAPKSDGSTSWQVPAGTASASSVSVPIQDPTTPTAPRGSASIRASGKLVHVDLTMSGLANGTSYPAHIHAGQCEAPLPPVSPATNNILYPFPDLQGDADGTSSESVDFFMNEDVIPEAGWYINVHLPDTSTVCGNVSPRRGSGMRYVPSTLAVHTGDTVTWTQPDPQEVHTVTFGDEPADPFAPPSGGSLHTGAGNYNSGPLSPGQSYGLTFQQPGTYSYICTLHDTLGMTGTIVVSGTAPPRVDQDGPSVASSATNRIDQAARGIDNAVWLRHRAATWTDYSSLGGIITSDPDLSSWGPGRLDVVARGNDGALWQRGSQDGNWFAWSTAGGGLSSGPSAVSFAPNRIDVFARGLDGSLWTNTWLADHWVGWSSLGGQITGAPDAASPGANLLDVLARGLDGAVWHRTFNGTQWSDWQSLGGEIVGGPGATSPAAGQVNVVAKGTDGAAWMNSFTGGVWSGWFTLGGQLAADPDATSSDAGEIDVLVRGLDGAVYQRSFVGGQRDPTFVSID